MVASVLLSSLCLAAVFAVPEMPEAEWDDTEVVTNAALPAARADSRVFAFTLELDATASNNVEVAFGHDADHDGVLSRGEAGLLVGWDCGEWFWRDRRANVRRMVAARRQYSRRVCGQDAAWRADLHRTSSSARRRRAHLGRDVRRNRENAP